MPTFTLWRFLPDRTMPLSREKESAPRVLVTRLVGQPTDNVLPLERDQGRKSELFEGRPVGTYRLMMSNDHEEYATKQLLKSQFGPFVVKQTKQ